MPWRCERCEAVHETKPPSCPDCGHDALVGTDVVEPVDAVESFVWACAECGREHVKNSPPCSRCGHPMLERREQTFDDVDDLPSGSYLAAVKPYAPLIFLFAVVIGLTATGTVSLSMLPWVGPPSLPDAPGDGETASGIDLETVEREVHDRLEAAREQRGAGDRSYDAELAHLAAYMNRNEVRVANGRESVGDPDPDEFDLRCSDQITVYSATFAGEAGIEAYDDESELAAVIDAHLRSEPGVESKLFDDRSAEALDVHVDPDGWVFVHYAVC